MGVAGKSGSAVSGLAFRSDCVHGPSSSQIVAGRLNEKKTARIADDPRTQRKSVELRTKAQKKQEPDGVLPVLRGQIHCYSLVFPSASLRSESHHRTTLQSARFSGDATPATDPLPSACALRLRS